MVNELLAPAGNLEAVKIAISYGADAVYCAGKRFGARSYINNLSEEEIIEAAHFVHLHGKKIYITLNTLIYEEEMEEVKSYIDFLYQHVDALIVQDFGVVHYLRTHYPDFPVHISTQCSIHNEEDAAFLKKIGVSRIVLARELSLEEIKKIKKLGVELEVFIHGALCFCYSGMCYLSFYKGGRSGNRGSCAQPCRQSYSLLEDGKPLTNGPLFSMKDLNTINEIRTLLSLGVSSLKIEGRAKSLEYLASAVKVYRKIIDDYNQGKKQEVPEQMIDDLLSSYSREMTKGYLNEESNKDITTANSVKHQGILIGEVIESYPKQAKIRLSKELCLLDGVRFVFGKEELGLTVTRIIENGSLVKKSDRTIILDVEKKLPIGAKLYKTSSQRVEQEMKTYHYQNPQEASLEVRLEENHQTILIQVGDISISQRFDLTLEKAISVKDEAILSQFSKTNGLPIVYRSKTIHNEGGYYLPIPILNKMRSSLLEELKGKLETRLMREKIPYPFLDDDSLFIKEKKQEEIFLSCSDIYRGLINPKVEKKQSFALHLAEIGNDSIVSPYFGIANSEAIKFFRNISKGCLILSYESSYENAARLAEIDSNLGYLVEYPEPLMVAKHCPVGKYYGAKNKHCGKCKSHYYEVKDQNRSYHLHFHDCTMFLLGKKVEQNAPSSLVKVHLQEAKTDKSDIE